jgi:hypothetical protein
VGLNIFVSAYQYNLNYIRCYPKPTNIVYISQFRLVTDGHMEDRFGFDPTHIFIGTVTSPMNICDLYLSNEPINIEGVGLTGTTHLYS